MIDPLGRAGAIPPREVSCPIDEFTNAIRKLGVVAACEWFGHAADSEFTRDTIKWLTLQSEQHPAPPIHKTKGCRACFGSGGKRVDPCKVCGGTGRVPA